MRTIRLPLLCAATCGILFVASSISSVAAAAERTPLKIKQTEDARFPDGLLLVPLTHGDAWVMISVDAEGKLTDNPLIHPVAAVSVGVLARQPLLDLAYVEDAAAEVDLNLVMNAAGEFIEVQGSGEEATFSQDQLSAMLKLGEAGIRELLRAQQDALVSAV